MARAREKIYNPVQEDSIEFRQTAGDTGGELLSGEMVVSPRGGNQLHVHPLQEEHFEVLFGIFGVQIGDERRSLGEGEEATVPPGTPHRWFNEDEQEDARILLELRPALNTETFFETLYGLARDGKTDKNGIPNLLQQAVTLTGINKGEIDLASPPWRCKRRSWPPSPRWGGCWATKTTTPSTAQQRHRSTREQARRP